MIVDHVQRWRNRLALFKKAVSEPLDPGAYEVAPIDGPGADKIAGEFVRSHHYSASYPAARERIGLYRSRAAWAVGGGELVGVAVFSVPAQGKVLDVLPCDRAEAVELGRLVLLDSVEANGESWFIARAFELLRSRGYAGVLSFADPVPRGTAAGEVVFPGHLGTIYQATNAVYTGRATPRTLRLLPDGRVFSARALSKVRAGERGWRYAVEQLVEAGAVPPEDMSAEGLRAWLPEAVAAVTRPLRHGGNHRYLWALNKAAARALPRHLESHGVGVQPYPKLLSAQSAGFLRGQDVWVAPDETERAPSPAPVENAGSPAT